MATEAKTIDGLRDLTEETWLRVGPGGEELGRWTAENREALAERLRLELEADREAHVLRFGRAGTLRVQPDGKVIFAIKPGRPDCTAVLDGQELAAFLAGEGVERKL